MKPHVAIVDPCAKTAELDTFNGLSRRSPLTLTYHLPGLFGTDSMKRSEAGMVGIVILGSSSSVYDDYPWQKELSDWLVPKMKGGLPTFGICFGHQLMGHLFGAKVGFVKPTKEKQQGFRQIAVDHVPAWKKLPAKGGVFVSHREMVLECPKGFRISASSPECPVDGLAHESLPLYSLQAHPEATEGLLHNLGYVGPLNDLSYGHGLIDAFLESVAARR